MLARAEPGRGRLVGAKFPFCKTKRVVTMDGGNGCTKMRTSLGLPNYTLKKVKMVACIFTYILAQFK